MIRYENSFTISDYWLGLFSHSDSVASPFFFRRPSVRSLQLGQTVVSVLRGRRKPAEYSYYSMRLPAGDYKVILKAVREDGRKSNVGGRVDYLGPEGNMLKKRVVSINSIDFSSKKSGKLSLAETETVIFRVYNSFNADMRMMLTVKPWL